MGARPWVLYSQEAHHLYLSKRDQETPPADQWYQLYIDRKPTEEPCIAVEIVDGTARILDTRKYTPDHEFRTDSLLDVDFDRSDTHRFSGEGPIPIPPPLVENGPLLKLGSERFTIPPDAREPGPLLFQKVARRQMLVQKVVNRLKRRETFPNFFRAQRVQKPKTARKLSLPPGMYRSRSSRQLAEFKSRTQTRPAGRTAPPLPFRTRYFLRQRSCPD